MITFSRLGRHGRLGNQMYQYAALLGVAQRRGFSAFIPPTRLHELGRTFQLTAPVGTADEFRAMRYRFTDDRIGWFPELELISDRTDIHGYFQATRFFADEASLRREYTFVDSVAEPARQAVALLRKRFEVLVAVTVRRGDYLQLADKFSQVWATDYYDRAFGRLEGNGVGFVISSDDREWCRQRFARADVVVLDGALSDQSALALLAACDHAVIANGSYGWWSGWLIDSPSKTVIAPARWFEHNAEFSEADRAPLPDGWLSL